MTVSLLHSTRPDWRDRPLYAGVRLSEAGRTIADRIQARECVCTATTVYALCPRHGWWYRS